MGTTDPRSDAAEAAPENGSFSGDNWDGKPKRSDTGNVSNFLPASLAPSLERLAGTAAIASQEAARYTVDHAKRYGQKVRWRNRAGRAPPGQDDSPAATMEWSGVGDRFSSLSWYEHQLIGDVVDGKPVVRTEGARKAARGDNGVGDLSIIATLEDVDEWVTSPIYEDESNVMDGLGSLENPDGHLQDGAEEQSALSPVRVSRRMPPSTAYEAESSGGSTPGSFFKSHDDGPGAQRKSANGVGLHDLTEEHSTSSDDTASSVSDTLKPVIRRSRGFVSSLIKKGTAAMAAYNESAGGGSSGDARDSDALLEEGSADDTSSICSASRESLNAGQLARLKQEASEGDPRAQSELRRLFGPPPLAMKRSCQECGEPFGVGRHQHHCKHCGGAFCLDHANQAHPLSRMGFPYPKRVCLPCKHILEVEDWRELVEWRLERIEAYLEDRLIDYFDYRVDTNVDKAWRVVDGASYVGKAVPMGSTNTVSQTVVDVLKQFGVAGMTAIVLRKEFVEAVDTLRFICGADKDWAMSVHEASAAMYYMMAERRRQRGDDPDGDHHSHRGCPLLSDDELAFIRRVSYVGLLFPYRSSLELQHEEAAIRQPSFTLMACRATATAVLGIRGTKSIEDVITDTQTKPVPFPPQRKNSSQDGDSGGRSERAADAVPSSACAGMARAAEWLHREVLHSLVKLRRAGHKILIMGHSLGAGVAALLGQLVREAIPDVRVIAFATPAIADLEFSKSCEDICTSIVLQDDIVPRVTPRAAQAMLKEAKDTKDYWTKHLQDDVHAVVDRAKGLWAPRLRGSLSAEVPDAKIEARRASHSKSPARSRVEGGRGDGSLVEGANGGELLPDLFVPGRIVHIYRQRGVYRACEVPRDHERLRTFPLYETIIADHDNKAYFSALEEIANVRKVEARGVTVPEWVPFSASDRCQLCKADFFWASTLRSEAQRSRDKHNCHMCGILVCNACSDHCKPLPQYGVLGQCRVCDRCFYVFQEP